jgi:hypothetical protein
MYKLFTQRLTIGISIIFLSLFPSLNVQAQKGGNKIELKIYSENEQKQSCPDKIIVTEIPRPDQEGSFATDGSVNLSEYAIDTPRSKDTGILCSKT